MHSKGLVFQEVKPENIVISDTNENQIFFIDFAFGEFYVNALGEPKKHKVAQVFNDKSAYMTRYTHFRKDDLISLGIVLLNLNGVHIPWMYKSNNYNYIEVMMNVVLEDWIKHEIKVS